MANQDTLTGLPNRHKFIDLIRGELLAERPMTVVMLDLDGFKDVNDTHGHSAGDSLLQAIAVRLPYLLRGDAHVARFGGDEFAILIPNVGDPVAAQSEAKAILDAFPTPFDVGGHVLDLGASVGFAIAPAHGIAFDDFGTGFASLSSLQRYPLTTLKIDRGFIANIIDCPGDAAITRALIMLSKELGLDTIAEGVETAKQEQALMSLGCPSAQGYKYGRPMPASDLERLLTGNGGIRFAG